MNKKSLVVLTAVLAVGLAAVGLPRLIQFLTPSDTSSVEEEPRYERVEAEKYEIVFPEFVNSRDTYANLYWSTMAREDALFFGSIELFDEDCLVGDDFRLAFQIYYDGILMSQTTSLYEVAPGEYGRYVISETQAADEPVAFTIELVYDYVLVD